MTPSCLIGQWSAETLHWKRSVHSDYKWINAHLFFCYGWIHVYLLILGCNRFITAWWTDTGLTLTKLPFSLYSWLFMYTDMNTSVISRSDPQSSTGTVPPEKSALDELRKINSDVIAIRVQMDNQFHKSKIEQEWQMIGEVVDRFFFGLYIIFITFSFVPIIFIWYYHGAWLGCTITQLHWWPVWDSLVFSVKWGVC